VLVFPLYTQLARRPGREDGVTAASPLKNRT
jgi:hypothetical protein